jgi:hypothetical protein
VSKLRYRSAFILGAFALTVAGTIWIWFAPGTDYSRIKDDDSLTIGGWMAIVCGIGVSLWFLPHVFNVIRQRPAIEVGEGKLTIWMLPYESIPLVDISKIEVEDGKVSIRRHGGQVRKINTGVTDEPRTFFFDVVAAQLGSRQLVQEK